MFDAFAYRLLSLAPYLLAGLVIEECTRVGRRIPRALRLNLLASVIYVAADVATTATWTALITTTVRRLPGAGVIPLPLRANATTGELAVLAFLYACAIDFFYYWFHRLQHTARWLWALHEIHHSDEHMNVTTARRAHWLEPSIMAIFVAAPIAYLFQIPLPIVVTARVIAELIINGNHIDSSLSLGRFNQIIATHEYHRIHHSREAPHIDKNFASILPLWDVLFGTYYAPGPGDYPQTGLVNGEHPTSLRQMAVWPFRRWQAMLGKRWQSFRSAGPAV